MYALCDVHTFILATYINTMFTTLFASSSCYCIYHTESKNDGYVHTIHCSRASIFQNINKRSQRSNKSVLAPQLVVSRGKVHSQ